MSQGGDQMELIPGGADIEVNATNVHDYVRKYAEYRMVKSAEKALEVNITFLTRKINQFKTAFVYVYNNIWNKINKHFTGFWSTFPFPFPLILLLKP